MLTWLISATGDIGTITIYSHTSCEDASEHELLSVTFNSRRVATQHIESLYADRARFNTMPGTFCDATTDTGVGASYSRWSTFCLGRKMWLRVAFYCEPTCTACYWNGEEANYYAANPGRYLGPPSGEEQYAFYSYDVLTDRDAFQDVDPGSCINRWVAPNSGTAAIDAESGGISTAKGVVLRSK